MWLYQMTPLKTSMGWSFLSPHTVTATVTAAARQRRAQAAVASTPTPPHMGTATLDTIMDTHILLITMDTRLHTTTGIHTPTMGQVHLITTIMDPTTLAGCSQALHQSLVQIPHAQGVSAICWASQAAHLPRMPPTRLVLSSQPRSQWETSSTATSSQKTSILKPLET